MLEQGEAQREVLAKHGLGETLLADLRAAVEEFEASVLATAGGLQNHVVARAELDTLSGEVMLLVGMLDGINQYRFLRDPKMLVAWETAKHVVVGPQVEAADAPAAPAGEGPVQQGPDEAKPAA